MNLANRAAISCQGKGSYTPTQARRIAESMRRKERGSMQAYHCQHCGKWHVGSRIAALPDRRREQQNRQENNDRSWDDGDE